MLIGAVFLILRYLLHPQMLHSLYSKGFAIGSMGDFLYAENNVLRAVVDIAFIGIKKLLAFDGAHGLQRRVLQKFAIIFFDIKIAMVVIHRHYQ